MARPTSQSTLLDAAKMQYTKLMSLIDSMNDIERSMPLSYGPDFKKTEAHWTRDQSLRDILVHLYEWHQLLLNWANSNLAGEAQPFLPKPCTWKTYGDMNVELWRKHQDTSYDEARQLLEESHRSVVTLIEGLSDEELFEKAFFPWTGTTSLGSYCVSATSSHYDWAMKKIRAHIRAQQALNQA